MRKKVVSFFIFFKSFQTCQASMRQTPEQRPRVHTYFGQQLLSEVFKQKKNEELLIKMIKKPSRGVLRYISVQCRYEVCLCIAQLICRQYRNQTLLPKLSWHINPCVRLLPTHSELAWHILSDMSAKCSPLHPSPTCRHTHTHTHTHTCTRSQYKQFDLGSLA